MIPIYLTFEAFGPFPKKETIDFTQFQADRLFLISGQTGSGKTTIFDAITFALFGEASGSMRQSDSFKSDFADYKTTCFVEFCFFVKGKKYVVRREPIQMKLKRNGNISKENSVATLTLENNSIISGTTTVDRYVTALLGITAEQFKKIVLLPQGEFRKFLSDDSAEKQKILRQIFGTKIFDDFIERLRFIANESKSQLEHTVTVYQTLCNNIQWLENEDVKNKATASIMDISYILSLLKEHNEQLKQQISNHQVQLESLQREKDNLNLPYYIELNKQFDQLEQAQKTLFQLHQKSEAMNTLKNKIQKMTLVKEQLSLFQTIESVKQQEIHLTQQKQSCLAEINNQEKTGNELEQKREKNKQQQQEIPSIIREIEKQKQNLLQYQEYLTTQAQYQTLLEKQSNLLQNQKTQAISLSYAKQHEKQCELLEQINQCNVLLMKLQQHKKSLEELFVAKKAYQQVFHQFIEGQAAILATDLKENQPCPVCGSLAHPHLAKSHNKLISQETLNQYKQNYDTIIQQVESLQADCTSRLNVFEFIQKPFSSEKAITFITNKLSMLHEQENEISGNLSELSLSFNISNKSLTSQNIEQKLSQLDTDLALIAQEIAQISDKLLPLNKTFESSQSNGQSFAIEIEKLEQKVLDIQNFAAQYETQLQEHIAQYERIKETLVQTELQLQTTKNTISEKEKVFHEFISKHHISLEQFHDIIEELPSLSNMQARLSDYEKDCSVQTALLSSLKQQLNGKSPVNLSALQVKASEIDEQIEKQNHTYLSFSAVFQNNQIIEQKIQKCYDTYNKQSILHAKQNKLFEVANGKYSDRVNFERFVLASYFDQVIENANIRLNQMTASRYTLMRRTEKEKGNKSSGLSLEVFDSYTGKSRHVNTASGGESFKFALSLALGLADIISQNSGGIELNTLFIDEGFGSLDSNSLDSAIECLEQLRNSGRYIGIISHVSELKEKISSKIIIIQHPTGSYISEN